MSQAYKYMAAEAEQEERQPAREQTHRGSGQSGGREIERGTLILIPDSAVVIDLTGEKEEALPLVQSCYPLEHYHQYNRINSRLARIWDFVHKFADRCKEVGEDFPLRRGPAPERLDQAHCELQDMRALLSAAHEEMGELLNDTQL